MGARAYFDNAATTWPKPERVYDAADAAYRGTAGSAGRGSALGAAGAAAHAARAKANLRHLLGCPAHDVAFTSSATDALNRVLLGAGLRPGDTVYATPLEHNAVTRPLRHLERRHGVRVRVLPFDRKTLLPDTSAASRAFAEEPPALVVATHASNVCGAVVPFRDLFAEARARGARTVLDMSQTAGLVDVALASEPVDFAVFAGHKTLLGPFGVGGIVCPRGSRLEPVLFGGNGVDSAEQDMPAELVPMVEVGSQNLYAAAGLEASTAWLLERGVESVRRAEEASAERLVALLRSRPNVHLVAEGAACETIGVVSATFDGYSPDEAGLILDRLGVSVRAGLHCAPWAHQFLGTMPSGTVRFSVGCFTDEEDFSVLTDALAAIAEG